MHALIITPAGPTIGAFVAPVVAVVLLAAVALSLYAKVKEAALLFGGFLLVVGLMSWPWSYEWHRYYHVTGTAESVSSRMIADGHGMSQRFVVVLDGRAFGIDDSRATTVHAGDPVDLMCRKDWQYAGTAGWVCAWNGDR